MIRARILPDFNDKYLVDYWEKYDTGKELTTKPSKKKKGFDNEEKARKFIDENGFNYE